MAKKKSVSQRRRLPNKETAAAIEEAKRGEGKIYRGSSRKVIAAWVNPDDASEWTKEQFERVDWYRGNKLIRRGRSPSEHSKNPQTFAC
jgi:hypothetical protein